MKLISIILISLLFFCNTAIADDWKVTWKPIKESIIDKEYDITVQNLQGVKRDVNISSFFAKTNFDISELADVKFFEWKSVPYNYTINHYDKIEHVDYNKINGTWNNWTESIFNYTEIIGSQKLDWKKCKKQLFKTDGISKENNYGFINIPACGSKSKGDGTYNGTKLFKLTFKTPIIHTDTYGSSGKFAVLLDGVEHHPYWNTSWSTRKEIILTGNTSGAQTDYQILLNVSYDSEMQSNFNDLRFCNDTDEIDSWLESKVDGSYALVWVEFPTTPANGVTQTYYVYYGNGGAASDWDIRATMLDGDDFSGSSLDSAIWNDQYCNVGVSGGVLTLDTFTGGLTGGVMGKRLLPITHVIESKIKNTYSGDIVQIGNSNVFQIRGDDSACLGLNDNAVLYMYTTNEGTLTYCGSSGYNVNQYYNIKIVLDGAGVHCYYDGNELTGSPITTNYPNEQTYLRIGGDSNYSPTINTDWIFARKYAANPPTYEFGSEGYYADSIHYNNTNPYNNTIDSNGVISVNRSIIPTDNIGWTASALTDDCHLVVTKHDLSDIIANFTIYTASLDWLTVPCLSSYTNYSLLFANGTLIESQITDDTGIVYFTTNLNMGSYIIEKGVEIDPFRENAYCFYDEMKIGLTDFKDSMGKYLVWGILFFAVGLAFTLFTKIKQTLIGGK